jgi:hypothetical protein
MAIIKTCNFIALTGLSATALYAAQPTNQSPVLSDSFFNTAMGPGTLSNNHTPQVNCVPYAFNSSYYYMYGCGNTASGSHALALNTTGGANTAHGAGALFKNTSGAYNTAIGALAMYSATSGYDNSAVGYGALFNNLSGSSNTASGAYALYSNNGTGNSALGFGTGSGQTTGSYDTYLGSGVQGVAGENYVTRIGVSTLVSNVPGSPTTFIAGIYNVPLSGNAVVVTSTGQLGVAAVSSERFKTDIAPMNANTGKLWQLRPVTFKLKTDTHGTPQYGLIAEEVAGIYPELVIRDENGRIDGVRYDELAPMLLNEAQKQQTTIAAQAAKIDSLERKVAKVEDLERQVDEMHAALASLQSRDHQVAQR